jgi:hypothetical protein
VLANVYGSGNYCSGIIDEEKFVWQFADLQQRDGK